MKFIFESRPSDSPFVEMVWRTQSEGTGTFISTAECRSEIVVTKQKGKTWLSVRGPETKATPTDFPADAEFFGIVFKLGTFMPQLPARNLLDKKDVHLPTVTNKSFWLNGSAWEFPGYENADTFLERLVRAELLVHDPVVDVVLQGQVKELSLRSVQRRFLQATGLTHNAVCQIKRAQRAMALLEQGVSILDTVEQAGYADQPHLTRSLKRFFGETPAQVIRNSCLLPLMDQSFQLDDSQSNRNQNE